MSNCGGVGCGSQLGGDPDTTGCGAEVSAEVTGTHQQRYPDAEETKLESLEKRFSKVKGERVKRGGATRSGPCHQRH